jgi:hypothetical protein
MFVYFKNYSIFATVKAIMQGIGEILKRPTRADCKSAVKTSQVRILLSPQKKNHSTEWFFYLYDI